MAGRAAFDIFPDVGSETGPPKFSCDKLTSFQVARVAGSFVVVTALEDGVAKGVIIGDIDVASIGQDTRFDLPIRKTGAERERDVVTHGLKGLKNKGVASRGVLNVMGQGYIDDVDKEGRGKESDSIVVVGLEKEIRAAGEGIWACKKLSWDVDHFQIKVSKVDEPAGLSTIEGLGGTEVGEVFMVSEDLYRERGSVEVVSPGFQGMNDTKEFSVVDVVVSFCRGERLGEVGTGVPFTIQVSL